MIGACKTPRPVLLLGQLNKYGCGGHSERLHLFFRVWLMRFTLLWGRHKTT